MAQFSLSTLIRPETRITILDVGASLTEKPPYQHLIEANLARVVGFEPDTEQCKLLNVTYGEPHAFFPYFIGDGGPAVFHETNWFPTGSLFRPNKAVMERFQNVYEHATLVAEHPVETRRLDDIPGIETVDYIKIDVQGAELMALKGGERLLEQVLFIQSEVEFQELYENQPMFADLDIYLRSRNFLFIKFVGFGARCVKPLLVKNDAIKGTHELWADAVYVKNWFQPDTFTPDQLIKLAILAHDLYILPDLAYHALKNLDARQGSVHASDYLKKLTGQAGPSA
jgi:FkbM family methyltransferase